MKLFTEFAGMLTRPEPLRPRPQPSRASRPRPKPKFSRAVLSPRLVSRPLWSSSCYVTETCTLLFLQELVVDIAVITSFRHADLSWARRFDVASPRFIGRRSASTVLSQDCWDDQSSVSNHQEDPKCRPVEHGNGLVRGQCSADGQRRTDDDCEHTHWLFIKAENIKLSTPVTSLHQC